MKTPSEIHDLIMECETDPNRKTLNAILNILEHMNGWLAQMEWDIEKLKEELNEDND